MRSAEQLVFLSVIGLIAAIPAACSGEETATGDPKSPSSSSSSSSSSSEGGGGAGGAGSSSSTGSTGGAGSTGGGGAGTGGEGAGGAAPWPTCDSAPAGVPTKTLPEIWQADPAAPTEVWVSGVYVTAIGKGACVAGSPCVFFVQADETYADLTAGAKHGLKVFASANTAQHFTSVAVGDRLDILAHAWRYTVDGQNELLLQVNTAHPGCIKKVGTGDPKPIPGVPLGALSVQAYEYDVGPLLVQVNGVAGKPGLPNETFALWVPGVFTDAGVETVTSLSPFFLAGSTFSGLTAEKTHEFSSVVGVFGLFSPPDGSKYEEIYPRAMADVTVESVAP